MKEIAFDTLTMMPKDSFVLIDIRDEGLTSYGMIPGAVNIPVDKLEDENNQQIADISKEKKLVFYCQIGRRSKELDNLACIEGREAFSLQDGYIRSRTANETDIEERLLKAEDSIRKKFHEQLFTPFAQACKRYQLISEGDRIAVCVSGGKDSMLMAKLFQEIQKHRKVSFELVFLVMDPGYNKENRAMIESTQDYLVFRLHFSKAKYSTRLTESRKIRAISVPECGAVTFTAGQKHWAATRSRWAIITMT